MTIAGHCDGSSHVYKEASINLLELLTTFLKWLGIDQSAPRETDSSTCLNLLSGQGQRPLWKQRLLELICIKMEHAVLLYLSTSNFTFYIKATVFDENFLLHKKIHSTPPTYSTSQTTPPHQSHRCILWDKTFLSF
jgi:hypothetical protein